jgi:hypothetical protein
MTTTTKTVILLSLTAVLTLGAAAPALAHCGPAHDGSGHDGSVPEHHATTIAAKPAIPHPTGPDDVVIHIEHSPNGWGGEYPEGSGVTVYGDGRVVIVPPSGAGGDDPPLPEATVLRVTEDDIQKLLRAAKRAGLLRDADYGEAGVTDQGTSVFEVTTGATHTASVYALLLEEGDRGLTRKQRAHREALRAFAHDAVDPDFYEGTLDTR